uniref:Methyltransferase domain-containing protein n=1 Tax=Trypanosoma congolense (strain IL3000) TaxID=1068625 RepID=G0UMY4_TRYCI|nr:conserved hypothetical protein [Trypanosoma congolense IL3000]
MCHRLVLPLPPAFQPSAAATDGFSVFQYGTEERSSSGNDEVRSNLCAQHRALGSYVDQLCEFLHKTRLIQYNPDDFFRLMLNSSQEDADDGVEGADRNTEEVLQHPDGRTVQNGELHYMRELCKSFDQLMPNNEALFNTLSTLIASGPPPHAAECLHSFYADTKRLMLSRKRRPQNDVARLTTRLPRDEEINQLELMEMHRNRKDRADRMLQVILGHGMGPKKQHEVRIMHDNVVDLITHCNTTLQTEESVQTVINIGEGKGYVSRALALCSGLQVVGLDCNPAHKERAAERISHFQHGCLSIDPSCPEMTGRDMINLLYEPGGHMASITCTVGETVDWTALLRGHVQLRADEHSSSDVVVSIEEARASLSEGQCEWTGFEATMGREDYGHPRQQENLAEPRGKLQCLICKHILRRDATRGIVRHVRHHLMSQNTVSTSTSGADIPTKDAVDEWNRKLSVEAFVEKLAATFFTDVELVSRDAPLALKRLRSAFKSERPNGDGTIANHMEMSEVKVKRKEGECHQEEPERGDNREKLVAVRLARGMRAEIFLPIKKDQHCSSAKEEDGGMDQPSCDLYFYSKTLVTIVGYDCAHAQHFIVRDDGRRKEAYTLLKHQGGSDHLRDEAFSYESCVPSAESAWTAKIALLLRILPVPSKETPAVRVPSLGNTIMMGLHSCGDLGSNICKLFASSNSRGLLLVSCCWHALTNQGFPISRELSRRGWCKEMISVLLATQPFDMWAAISSEGHRASASLLFYRSLLKRLWQRLQIRWSSKMGSEATVRCCCPLPDVPHLEPAFLRRMEKVKHKVTLGMLFKEVCCEYFSPESDPKWRHLWSCNGAGKVVCATCRVAQVEFLECESSFELAARMDRKYFDSYFSSFVGLTVLRMWMCHLVETLLLLDRAFYLVECLITDGRTESSAVSLVPLFDGSISPRMYAILARRVPFPQ